MLTAGRDVAFVARGARHLVVSIGSVSKWPVLCCLFAHEGEGGSHVSSRRFFLFLVFLLVFILVPPSWDALVVLPLGAVFEKETATNPHTHIANSNVLFVAYLLNKKI